MLAKRIAMEQNAGENLSQSHRSSSYTIKTMRRGLDVKNPPDECEYSISLPLT